MCRVLSLRYLPQFGLVGKCGLVQNYAPHAVHSAYLAGEMLSFVAEASGAGGGVFVSVWRRGEMDLSRFRRQIHTSRRILQRRYARDEYFVLSLRSPVSVLRTGAQVLASENVRLKMAVPTYLILGQISFTTLRILYVLIRSDLLCLRRYLHI